MLRERLSAFGFVVPEIAAQITEPSQIDFERCRLFVDGSLQLSAWEREPDSPGADPGGLIRETFKALAAPN